MKIPETPRAGLASGVFGVIVLSPDALLLRLFGGEDSAFTAGRGFSLALPAGVCVFAFPPSRAKFCCRAKCGADGLRRNPPPH